MKPANTVEQLNQIIADARKKLDVFERKRRAKEQAALIGRCYKYRNSYGAGSHWWLYSKVITRDRYWPLCFEFQITDRNEVKFKGREQLTHLDGWTEISATEFNRALNLALTTAKQYANNAAKVKRAKP